MWSGWRQVGRSSSIIIEAVVSGADNHPYAIVPTKGYVTKNAVLGCYQHLYAFLAAIESREAKHVITQMTMGFLVRQLQPPTSIYFCAEKFHFSYSPNLELFICTTSSHVEA